MKFSHKVVGPDFDKADIVSFNFGDAEVSLIVPSDPDADLTLGFIAHHDQTVLPDEPGIHWYHHPFGFRVFDLVRKGWSYYDEDTALCVAASNFVLNLIEVSDAKRALMNPLRKHDIAVWLNTLFGMIAVDGEEDLQGTESESCARELFCMPRSEEDFEWFNSEVMDWPMLTIRIPQGDNDEDRYGPDYFIYIPLNDRLILHIDSSISIISREGSKIALSKAEIIQLKRDILMEILSCIRVTYSPEILSMIEELNKLDG